MAFFLQTAVAWQPPQGRTIFLRNHPGIIMKGTKKARPSLCSVLHKIGNGLLAQPVRLLNYKKSGSAAALPSASMMRT